MSGMWPERLQFVSAIFVYGAGQRALAGIGRASVLRVGRMRSISVIVVCGGEKNEAAGGLRCCNRSVWVRAVRHDFNLCGFHEGGEISFFCKM